MSLPQRTPAPETAQESPLLALIRLSALDCRASARASVTACATIDPSAPPEVFAMDLVRLLPQLLERRPLIWRPGTPGMSFDEAWLMALVDATQRGDRDSERFLLQRRARPEAIDTMRRLVRGLARRVEPQDPPRLAGPMAG